MSDAAFHRRIDEACIEATVCIEPRHATAGLSVNRAESAAYEYVPIGQLDDRGNFPIDIRTGKSGIHAAIDQQAAQMAARLPVDLCEAAADQRPAIRQHDGAVDRSVGRCRVAVIDVLRQGQWNEGPQR
jgi:hypothetical protein